MYNKEETSLYTLSNKIGFALILGNLLIMSFDMIAKRFFNINFDYGGIDYYFLAIVFLYAFGLRLNVKQFFLGKPKNKQFKFKEFLLLTLIFLFFNKAFSYSIIYISGYYKLSFALQLGSGVQTSNNFWLIAIKLFLLVLLEEIIYIGIILEHLRKYGDIFAIIASGIIFGLGHGEAIIWRSMAGFLLGIIYVLNGNVRWTLLFHYIYDLMSGLDDLLSKYLPNFNNIQIYLIILASAIILTVVFLIVGLKDKPINDLFHKWNLKNIISKLKQDKHMYITLCSTIGISLFIILKLTSTLFSIVVKLQAYLKK